MFLSRERSREARPSHEAEKRAQLQPSAEHEAAGEHGKAGDARSRASEAERRSWNFSQVPVAAGLRIGARDDLLEGEADRTADAVMLEPAHGASVTSTAAQISRHGGAGDTTAGLAPNSVHCILETSGQPLDARSRAFFEPRFGRSFSDVRVHSGGAAEQSARDVDADAYTFGRDVVFAAGRFAPGTRQGRWLLAHELTHVVQQANCKAPSIRRGPPKYTVPDAAPEIFGGSGSTSETEMLYFYGNLEGRESFNSPPGYPRLTDCGIATTQAEAAEYTGTAVREKLEYRYELRIDRTYFEQNFSNKGTKKGYSEFGTRLTIPTRYFRKVFKLTPTALAPAAKTASGTITTKDSGPEPAGGKGKAGPPNTGAGGSGPGVTTGPTVVMRPGTTSGGGAASQTSTSTDMARAIASLEAESTKAAHLTGRIRTYVAAYALLKNAVALLDTLDAAEQIFFSGTLFAQQQREADKAVTASADALGAAEESTAGNAYLFAVIQIGQARDRGDQHGLFAIEESLIKLGAELSESAKEMGDMAADIEPQAAAMKRAAENNKRAATQGLDDAAMAEAAAYYISTEKLGNTLGSAAENYRKAAAALGAQYELINSAADEAEEAAWALGYSRIIKAQHEIDEKQKAKANH